VVVGQVDAQTISVRDAGARIEARDGCTTTDAHNARCVSSGAPLTFALVETGDLNDRIRSFGNAPPLPDPQLSGSGGQGDDELIGGESDDHLDGGGGHDRLLGAAGADTLRDGDYPGEADADVLVGGPDVDTVDYSHRQSATNIDLRDATTPEGDKLVTVENVYGGDAVDRLTGDGYANVLLGGFGADQLHGRAGDDILRGQDGFDSLFCGSGTDTAWVEERRDFVAPDCETVYLPGAGFSLEARPYPTRGATFMLGCPTFDAPARRGPCSGKLVLRETRGRPRLLGTGTISQRGPAAKPVRVKLTKAGRRLAHGRSGVLAIVTLKGNRLPVLGWTIRLRLTR
jgi:hypothetical protein